MSERRTGDQGDHRKNKEKKEEIKMATELSKHSDKWLTLCSKVVICTVCHAANIFRHHCPLASLMMMMMPPLESACPCWLCAKEQRG
jgi:hypothetical protein